VEIRLSELKRAYPNGGLFSYNQWLYIFTDKHNSTIYEIACLNTANNHWIYFTPRPHIVDDECIVNYIREM
jgi:hypothetical protein